MREKVLTLVKHPLISGSGIVFVGSLTANVLNYIFNLSMGRLLTEADFGLMSALNSLLILVGIMGMAFSNVVAKFSAKYFGLSDKSGSSRVLHLGLRFVLLFSSATMIIMLAGMPLISRFLHVTNYLYIFLVILAIFFSLVISLPHGFIQGRMQFVLLSGVSIIQPLLRLVIALILVFSGYALLGPFVGLALSVAIPAVTLLAYVYKKYATHYEKSISDEEYKKEFIHYTYTFFLSGIGLTLLSNTDIILARHFLTPIEAGQYAALSLMGKAIFYFTSPIGTVFFPLIAYKKERKEALFKTVFFALSIIVLTSVALSFVYFAFPQLILAIFFPREGYSVLADYLGYYSLYILVFSLVSIFTSYFLSVGKTKIYIFTLIAAISQILLISLFHASLYQIIGVLFVNSFILLVAYIIYYWKNERN